MFCSTYVCGWTHTYTQGWSEAHRIPTAYRRGRSTAPGSFAKGGILQPRLGGSSIPSSSLRQHTCPMSAASGTGTETSTLVLCTNQVKNLNFTKYALKKKKKNKKIKQQKIQNSQTWLPLYSQYSILLLGHLTKVPREGRGRSRSKVEPQRGPTAEGCSLPQPLSPPVCFHTPCSPQTRSLQELAGAASEEG